MHAPRLTPLAASLPDTVPFVGPETQERAMGQMFAARLGANESGFGPAPAAIAALQAVAGDVWMYGDPEAHDLKSAIAGHHGVSPAHVVVGEGIDALLGLTVRLMIAAGDVAVTSAGAYPTFNFHVAGFGGRLVRVPYRDNHEDPSALLAAARAERARLVYLANPDNPMGSWHPAATITAMVADLPQGALLILDEAYADLAPGDTVPELDADDPRVIRMRSFSKAHGLAGLRVGYALAAPPLARAFDKVRNHFGLGRAAQAAALAALGDHAHLARVQRAVARARARVGAIAAEHGLVALPSATNFVTIDCGRDAAFARHVLAELGQRGVFVRMPGVSPLDRCIRVSLGPDPALDIFAATFGPALRAAAV
ncbi:MAG: pyridoxal phosphate-dependent aminotransferase [Pseudomonadota bacterium]